MKHVFLFALLLISCGDPGLALPTNNDWDCSESTTTAHRAFVECVTAMGLTTQHPYDASQCEDYAHRNFCVSRKAKENDLINRLAKENRETRKELVKAQKLSEKYHKQRNVFCATLMAECIMYGIETKQDRHCEDACVIDDEDVSKEVDKEIKAEKESQ